MATYVELFDLANDQALIDRVAIACVVAAETIRNEADTVNNHANRLLWAARAFADPRREAQRFIYVLMAQNKDATVTTIKNADDSTVQNAVDAAIDVFATG